MTIVCFRIPQEMQDNNELTLLVIEQEGRARSAPLPSPPPSPRLLVTSPSFTASTADTYRTEGTEEPPGPPPSHEAPP